MIQTFFVLFLLFTMIVTALGFFFNKILLKLSALTLLTILSIMIYFSFDTFKGWPSTDPIIQVYVTGIHIVPPEPGEKGAIYVWGFPRSELPKFLEYRFPLPAPRAYYLPYSENAEKKMTKAKKKLQEGMVVTLTEVKQDGEEGNGTGDQQNSKNEGEINNTGSDGQEDGESTEEGKFGDGLKLDITIEQPADHVAPKE
jgi:hypothetical protein